MYKNTYSAERLKANKFTYISGTTISFNKILAESLHRNILQRYRDLHTLRDAIVNLPPIANDEICDVLEKPIIDGVNPVEDEIAPKVRIEYGFWLLVILVIALIVMLFTTNIYTVLFGVKKEKLQYTGFTFGTTEDDSTRVHGTHESFMRREAPMSTEYGTLKRDAREEDSRRLPPAPMNNATASTPYVSKNKPSSAFVYIEPGTLGFGRLGENLAHNVSLSGFYICKYELTQGEWNRYMKPANVTQVGDNLPVDNVSWYDIAIYCNGRSEAEGLNPAYKIRGVGAARVISCNFAANGYRLPTEAEWEIAAKAGQIYNYSGSNDPDEVAWYRDNSAGKIRNPASKAANDFGIYDMTGNVSEWVWDWYDANFLRALPTFINPTGPQAGTLKTIRGGSVMNGEGRNLNILWREKGDPNKGYQFIGFRLVRSN
jgi:formylglycine-generating enzyme required for sulfatase activity